MRHEHERRKTEDLGREAFRNVIAGMNEAQILCLEALIVRQVDKCNALGMHEEAYRKIELLSDIDDRLKYLEGFTISRIINGKLPRA